MGDKDIQGTVTDAEGNPVPGAVVALWDQDDPDRVITTTADSNGNYIFSKHPDGGTATNWHVAARDPNDGTRQFPSLHSVSTQLFDDIPDSVVNRWPIQQGSGTTLTDTEGGDNGTFVGDPQWESVADDIGGYQLLLDGTDDGVDTPATSPSGSLTFLLTIDISSDIASNQRLQNFDDGSSGQRFLRFGDSGTPRELEAFAANDSGIFQSAAYQLPSQGRFRVGLVLDTADSELRIAVNGSVESSTAISGSFTSTSGAHSLGYNRNNNGENFGGSVDEPIIADTAYTSQKLTDDYSRQPWS